MWFPKLACPTVCDQANQYSACNRIMLLNRPNQLHVLVYDYAGIEDDDDDDDDDDDGDDDGDDDDGDADDDDEGDERIMNVRAV